jgi:hypothetical protein
MSPILRHRLPASPVAWALLSQAIWLPLIGIDLHDRLHSQLDEQRDIAAAIARGTAKSAPPPEVVSPASSYPVVAQNTGILLGSARNSANGIERPPSMLTEADRVPQGRLTGAIMRSEHIGAAGVATSESAPFTSAARPSPIQSAAAAEARSQGVLVGSFNRAELLGGNLGLRDLNGAIMPPLAMAERARWAGSSDPLAPLPAAWREPMRKALNNLPISRTASSSGKPSVIAARVILVPSTRVQESTSVPLALQPDGSVDILTQPKNSAVLDEIRQWSARQDSRGAGGITAAVVQLEPLPADPRAIRPQLAKVGITDHKPLSPAASTPLSRAVLTPGANTEIPGARVEPASSAPVAIAPAPMAAPAPAAPMEAAPPVAVAAPVATVPAPAAPSAPTSPALLP